MNSSYESMMRNAQKRADKLTAELAAEREKVERLEPMAEFGQRLLDMTESLTDPVVTQADDKVDAYIEVFIRQKREIERLEAALKHYADRNNWYTIDSDCGGSDWVYCPDESQPATTVAAAALNPDGEKPGEDAEA